MLISGVAAFNAIEGSTGDQKHAALVSVVAEAPRRVKPHPAGDSMGNPLNLDPYREDARSGTERPLPEAGHAAQGDLVPGQRNLGAEQWGG